MRHLIATNTKFIAGAKAFRLWIETDDDHPHIDKTFNARIMEGRRVIAPEGRFGVLPPIDIEEYNHDTQAAGTGKLEPARISGVRVSDDFPDSEIDGAGADVPSSGGQ